MNSRPQHAGGSEKANFVRINYGIESNSFLERGKNQLREFDETRPDNLFYSALELRMGIEARLFEFIRGRLKEVPRNLRQKSPQHIFGKLLSIAPEARKPIEVGIAITFANGSNDPVRLTHTPVTKKLVKC